MSEYKLRELLITNPKGRPHINIIPRGIVVHWTANQGIGANAQANRNYFQNCTRNASAHYCVDNAEVVRCVPEREMAYHVGAKIYKTKALGSYPNNCTIGIEMCVNSDGNFWGMWHNTVYLVADLMIRYKLGIADLYRHYDVTGKTCPAFFVSEVYAKQYGFTSAAAAWSKFKDDVARVKKVLEG